MIGRIRGTLADVAGDRVIVEAAGVGYEIELTAAAREQLPKLGEQAVVATHLLVRDDGHWLFGFVSTEERELFRVLIRTSGVGPKLAMAILSTVTPGQLVGAVAAGDSAVFRQVPGVGGKTAARLLVELKDRLDHLETDASAGPAAPAAQPAPGSAVQEAERALVTLGFKPVEAMRMVAGADSESEDDQPVAAEALIRAALRRAGQRPGDAS